MQETVEKRFIRKEKGQCFESGIFLFKKNRLSQM